MAKLDSTLKSTDSIAQKLDQGVINELPALLEKINSTLTQYETLAKNTNRIVETNDDAINNFSQQGLAQVGPAIAELRTLLKQLRRLVAEIEQKPNALIVGKNKAEEFEP
jgi:phospholipid/cholesterol/gamma-HCH transport system substrate-binding protein